MIKHHNTVQVQFLVQWTGCPIHEATWEVAADFCSRFPDFPIPLQTSKGGTYDKELIIHLVLYFQ